MNTSFTLANVKAGKYFLIDELEQSVVATIKRAYRPAPVGTSWWSDGYILRWRETNVEERFKNLRELHEVYHIVNYPGYGAILK